MKTNYAAGHEAEKLAAKYLESQGFKIRELNWKTRYCEIDIVAEKDTPSPPVSLKLRRPGRLRRAGKTIYFVEVKYRRNAAQGIGLEYITPKKLKQMRFAAEMWVQKHDWPGDYQMAAVSIDGEQITFIDEL